MNIVRSAKANTSEIISSILLALFIDIKILNSIIIVAFPYLSNIMAGMYFIVMLALLINAFFYQKARLRNLSTSQILISLIIVLLYFFTLIFIHTPSVEIPSFIVFTIFPLLIPAFIKIDIKVLLLSSFIMPSWGILYTAILFVKEIAEFGVISMGLSYALLVPVLASLVYMLYYYTDDIRRIKLILIPFFIINIFYLLQLAMFGSRGPLLCIILAILCFFILKLKVNGGIGVNKKNIIIVIFISLIGLFSFLPILLYIHQFLSQYDISLNFVDKFLRLENGGDMSNGRGSISDLTINAILKSPIWGYGIAQFEFNTGEVYPHNFILQILYDGGIILGLMIFIPLIKKIKWLVDTIQKNFFILIFFLFFSSVPGALFSGDLWNANILWLLFGYLLCKKNLIRRLT